MKTGFCWLRFFAALLFLREVGVASDPQPTPSANTVRVAAAQAARRTIDFRLPPAAALTAVDKNLSDLERIIDRAGEAKCDALALPEDTLSLLNWLGANETLAGEVLPKAVQRMLERLGSAAAGHRMYLIVCSDSIESDGGIYNTAFLLGRDGKEMGRYHKVCPTWSEAGARQRGSAFPVFPTPDLGTAGLLICYDLVMPETARCLALQGADIIFFPTMGGAAIGDGDIGVQALRARAAENFIWLVVAHRGGGAMIISPQGKIVAQAEGPDGLAIADINPRGQREGGDAFTVQTVGLTTDRPENRSADFQSAVSPISNRQGAGKSQRARTGRRPAEYNSAIRQSATLRYELCRPSRGPSSNWQRDMRARLFRERKPEAFHILTEPQPPVVDKVPIGLTRQEAGRIMARALTLGDEEFKQASELQQRGKTGEAIAAFERLRKVYPATWIDRVSQQRLAKLEPAKSKPDASEKGLAAKYPGDVGIGNDPRTRRTPVVGASRCAWNAARTMSATRSNGSCQAPTRSMRASTSSFRRITNTIITSCGWARISARTNGPPSGRPASNRTALTIPRAWNPGLPGARIHLRAR
ncbi:MAG: carbon-nitrogen hydrolase family protein [Verrucomicrobia bacterium]|nr:carbon-nitrogen hydrolase family protein [Verrucomicrobiota bacterium]